MKYKIFISCILIALIAFQAFVVLITFPELRVLEVDLPAGESQSIAKRIEFQERVNAHYGQFISVYVLISDVIAIPVLAILLVLLIKKSSGENSDQIVAKP